MIIKQMENEKIICWFSCGITSAVSCKLAIDTYGKDNCEIIYIQIDSAHPDNKRFIEQCENWFDAKIKTVQSHRFKDQFEVIEKIKYINGVNGASCTKILKKDVRTKIEKQIPFKHQVFGFEFEKKEINRAIRFKEQYAHTKPIFPLIERQLTKEQCAFIIQENGIDIPKMYKLGFSNNNCIGCVKGGMGYWNNIKKHFPIEFEKMVELENKLNRSCINGKFLKDLQPNDGINEPQIMPDCGLFCEVEFADLLSKKTNQILNGTLNINQA